MMVNQLNSLSISSAFKNSDKSGRLSLACYPVNASKKEKRTLYAQYCASQRQKIIRCYEGITLKNMHTDEPPQSSKISNKKQSP